MPEFNRFDVCEAWYIFLCQWHDGRGEGWASYRRLSKLLTYFKPRPGLDNEDDLEENGRLIFEALQERIDPDLAIIRQQLYTAIDFMADTPSRWPEWWMGDMPAAPHLFTPESWHTRNKPIERAWDSFLSALENDGQIGRLDAARELPIADLLAASSVAGV